MIAALFIMNRVENEWWSILSVVAILLIGYGFFDPRSYGCPKCGNRDCLRSTGNTRDTDPFDDEDWETEYKCEECGHIVWQ